jgi:hypothetical protein
MVKSADGRLTTSQLYYSVEFPSSFHFVILFFLTRRWVGFSWQQKVEGGGEEGVSVNITHSMHTHPVPPHERI